MTDVHFQPQAAASTVLVADNSRVLIDNSATEMAAFEKGRMQGELEAIRRMENEQQLKSFPVEQPIIQRPDVLEINRLTWLQRLNWAVAECAGLAVIALTIVWAKQWGAGFNWDNNYRSGTYGDYGMYNTGLLTGVLGIFFLAQAISHYRILPLNLNPWLNRLNFCFWYSCAIVCFTMTLVAMITTSPDDTFWGVDDWCFALAYSVVVLHGLYSMARCLLEPMRAVNYETWTETNNKVTNPWGSPEQRRDLSQTNQAGRTVYTPAPVFNNIAAPPANQNVGAEVPVAPGNAPRWAENPNTHAEDYFLMPRAKWGVCGFVGITAAILMYFAGLEHNLAAGNGHWSQNPQGNNGDEVGPIDEKGSQAAVLGATGVLLLASSLMFAYASMPPRTTLVKNGILQDANRRTSISHTADTRLGPNMV